MKKLKNILLPVAMILVVVLSTSCGTGSNATKTFEKEQNGIKTTVTFTYIEKEDKVIKQNYRRKKLKSRLKAYWILLLKNIKELRE